MRKLTTGKCLRILGGALCGTLIGIVLLATGSPAVAGGTASFEAEKAQLTGAFKKDGAVTLPEVPPREAKEILKEASGKSYIGIPEDGEKEAEPAAGKATIKFTVDEQGAYTIWARAWWFDTCANSFKIKIDDFDAFVIGQDNTFKTWHWVKGKTPLPLKPGEHTMVIENNEDGALVDQFFVTTGRIVPQGAMATNQ